MQVRALVSHVERVYGANDINVPGVPIARVLFERSERRASQRDLPVYRDVAHTPLTCCIDQQYLARHKRLLPNH